MNDTQETKFNYRHIPKGVDNEKRKNKKFRSISSRLNC